MNLNKKEFKKLTLIRRAEYLYDHVKLDVEKYWHDIVTKRPCTRTFYEHCVSIRSGYMSEKAMDLKPAKRCHDHVTSPQTMFYYIADCWDQFVDFENFLEIYKFCSTTIAVTPAENTALSGYTINEGDGIKVTCSITERYDKEGIRLYKEGVCGGFVDKFPIEFSESFLKYERDNLILT